MTQLEQIQQAAREFRVAQRAFRDAPLRDMKDATERLKEAWERVLRAIEVPNG